MPHLPRKAHDIDRKYEAQLTGKELQKNPMPFMEVSEPRIKLKLSDSQGCVLSPARCRFLFYKEQKSCARV